MMRSSSFCCKVNVRAGIKVEPTLPLPLRYDVLLKADHPSRTYFITVASQYRAGAPYGYGFLRYSNASASDLPPTPTVQSGTVMPWNQSQIAQVCGSAVHLRLREGDP